LKVRNGMLYVTQKSTLQTIQALSGLTFSSYLSLHIFNTCTAVYGPLAYDEVQNILRKCYHHSPYVEYGIVLGSAGIHIISSLILILQRKINQRRLSKINKFDSSATPTSSPTLLQSIRSRRFSSNELSVPLHLTFHRWSGIFLMSVITGHVLATRGPIWFFGFTKPVDFAYIAFSLEEYRSVMFPYYVLLSTAGLYHLIYGFVSALGNVNWVPGTIAGKSLKKWFVKKRAFFL